VVVDVVLDEVEVMEDVVAGEVDIILPAPSK
jgi:hypothetical protein